MFHPFFKVVKKTYIALIMLSIVHYIPAQVPETASLPGVNQVECSLGMWIEKVVGNQKAWKVVISGKKIMWIDVKGFDFTPSEPYEWGLGSGSGPGYHNRWILQSATSLVYKGFIPQYALPELNDEFGSMNGTIRLKDKYNNPVYSTDLRPNKKAQVFFLKDEPNFWHPEEPNWSYYWKQIVDKKKITGFNFVTDIEKTCGSKAALACVHRFQTEVYYRQKVSENSGWTTNKGIHSFIEILAHENEHLEINNELWGGVYDSALDLDTDFYPDWWEDGVGAKYGFLSNSHCDKYGKENGCANVQDYGNLNNINNSAGFKYEESRCIHAQKTAIVNEKDHLDWSFDPKNTFQGKNWK
jgi:hypothetical protein